jgi:hypothetical protein
MTMPKVNGKRFPYSARGKAAAKKAKELADKKPTLGKKVATYFKKKRVV